MWQPFELATPSSLLSQNEQTKSGNSKQQGAWHTTGGRTPLRLWIKPTSRLQPHRIIGERQRLQTMAGRVC